MKRLIIPLVGLFLLCGCAALMRPPAVLTLDQARAIVQSLGQSHVKQFFATGSLVIQENQEETRLGFFWAGSRAPLKLKIELTHSWGGQVLEALVSGHELWLKDHMKKRSYQGPWSASLLNKVFPDLFTPQALWALLAGRVPLVDHRFVRIQGPDKILLLDQMDRILQVIAIDPTKDGLPVWTAYPRADLELWFSWKRKKTQGLPHAKSVRINLVEQGRSISIQFKSLVYNKPIPKEVFILPGA